MEFEYDLEANLLLLAGELRGGAYRHGLYRRFEINDNKRRLIAVAQVRDRLVHRLLYEYLVRIYDSTFSYHVWSCRQNKGLDGALRTVRRNERRYHNGWVWRGDIRKFFDSVDQGVLLKILQRRLSGCPIAMTLSTEIVASYGVERKGMAIGNLTSQIFANIYLNEFDRYVLHVAKPLGYVRYGDDFMTWWPDSVAAHVGAHEGVRYLREVLWLETQSASSCIQRADARLHVLGVELWPQTLRLDARMRQRMMTRLDISNYASYKTLVDVRSTYRKNNKLARAIESKVEMHVNPYL